MNFCIPNMLEFSLWPAEVKGIFEIRKTFIKVMETMITLILTFDFKWIRLSLYTFIVFVIFYIKKECSLLYQYQKLRFTYIPCMCTATAVKDFYFVVYPASPRRLYIFQGWVKIGKWSFCCWLHLFIRACKECREMSLFIKTTGIWKWAHVRDQHIYDTKHADWCMPQALFWGVVMKCLSLIQIDDDGNRNGVL